MSDAKNFSISQAINPYYHQESVDFEKAIREHDAIKKLFVSAGIDVVTVPSPVDCQDGVYTANWALVRGDKAVLASLPNVRKAEEAYAEKVLTDLGKKIIHLPTGLRFSGQGDALPCGNLLFCGSRYRSDVAAQEFVANELGFDRIQLEAIPETDENGKEIINGITGWNDSCFYDIDLAIAVVKPPVDGQKGLIAYCPEAFTKPSQEILENLDAVDKITVSIDEAANAFATNLVSTGETVIMSAHAPELAQKLKDYGLKILSPEITELSKGGGYIRCVSLSLE